MKFVEERTRFTDSYDAGEYVEQLLDAAQSGMIEAIGNAALSAEAMGTSVENRLKVRVLYYDLPNVGERAIQDPNAPRSIFMTDRLPPDIRRQLSVTIRDEVPRVIVPKLGRALAANLYLTSRIVRLSPADRGPTELLNYRTQW
jgi:hypothetical protein